MISVQILLWPSDALKGGRKKRKGKKSGRKRGGEGGRGQTGRNNDKGQGYFARQTCIQAHIRDNAVWFQITTIK